MPDPLGYGVGTYGEAIYGGVPDAVPDPPRTRWDLILTLPDGTKLADLTGAVGRKPTFRLGEPSSLDWGMNGFDPSAKLVEELATDVVAYRDGVPLLRTRVGASSDDLAGDRHDTTFTGIDYRGVLVRRTLWPGSTPSFTGEDQASIAWDLISDSQALPGGDLGITPGVGATTGVLRDRTYEEGKKLSEAIDQLAQVDGGFDWDIGPDLAFNAYYPARGALKDFVVHHNITTSGIKRTVDPSSYANAVRHSGADGGPTPVTRTVADLASRREGRWESQVGDTDVTVASTLAEKADWLLSESSVIRPSYTATLAPGVWDGPSTLWLGDTCRLVIRSGRLDVDTTVRVFEIAISIGDDGGETVEVTFDRPRSSFIRKASRDAARIDQLERR